MADIALSTIVSPPVFTSGANGLVPASGGGTTNFLRADGTFAAPPGGSGGISWSTISSANVATAVTNTGYIMSTGGTLRTVTLPAAATAGFNVTVKAVGGQVRVVSNGNVVAGIGSGNDIILNDGMVVSLVASATSAIEVVYAGATDTTVNGNYTVLSKTSAYTGVATSGKVIIKCDASGGAFTITLPTAVGSTAEYVVKKIDSSTNFVTVATTSSQTIDGGTTAVIKKQYEAVDMISDNANWNII